LDFRWSPDSKTLAVSMGKKGSGATSTFLVSADGGQSRELAPPDHEAPFWAPDGRTLALNSCAKGYCRVETWSADGALIRHLSEGDSLYEYPGHWSPDGTQLVVGWQELKGDGGYRIDLRPATGGAAHTLVTLPGYDMFAAGFASAGKVVIAVGRPSGNVIQRIDVPPVPAKK
jgi:Tol biopolymer transport system component